MPNTTISWLDTFYYYPYSRHWTFLGSQNALWLPMSLLLLFPPIPFRQCFLPFFVAPALDRTFQKNRQQNIPKKTIIDHSRGIIPEKLPQNIFEESSQNIPEKSFCQIFQLPKCISSCAFCSTHQTWWLFYLFALICSYHWFSLEILFVSIPSVSFFSNMFLVSVEVSPQILEILQTLVKSSSFQH